MPHLPLLTRGLLLATLLAGCKYEREGIGNRNPYVGGGGPAVVTPESTQEAGYVEGALVDDPGEEEFTVPATEHDTQTGWFLKTGDRVKVSAGGEWTMWKGNRDSHGPGGDHKWGEYDGCTIGALVARVIRSSPAWESKLFCIKSGGEVVAPFDGQLTLGPNDGGVQDNDGAMSVSVKRLLDVPEHGPAPLDKAVVYGAKKLVVDAKAKWVSTGLYARPGDVIGVQARGNAKIDPNDPKDYGPVGTWGMHEGCFVGMLRGVIGTFKDGAWQEQSLCLGRDAKFVATHEGLLVIGVTDGWYPDNSGELSVIVSGPGRKVPEVGDAKDLAIDARLDGMGAAAYGRRVVRVPSSTLWVSAGLFLKAGQTAHIEARGEWDVGAGRAGPEGSGETRQGCTQASLRAAIGLDFEDYTTRIVCIGHGTDVTATRDGLLYLGATDDSRGLADNTPDAVWALVTSDGDAAPVIPLEAAKDFDYGLVGSGWVEVRGPQVALTLPASAAQKATGEVTAKAATEMNRWLETMLGMVGETPRKALPYRLYPNPALAELGRVVIGGTPIAVDPAVAADGLDGVRLLAAHEGGDPGWQLMQAMGETLAGYNWGIRFAPGTAAVQAWGDMLARYTVETLALPGAFPNPCETDAAKDFLEDGTFDELQYSREAVGCLLLEIRTAHGWEPFKGFFAAYHAKKWEEMPAPWDDRKKRWAFARDLLNAATGTDLTALFMKYKVQFP